MAALLGSSRPLRSASAFVAGEALAVGAIVTVVVVVAAASLEDSLESTLAVMQLGIAALLVVLLIAHTWKARDEPTSTRVLAALDGVGPPVAFMSGAAMVAVNPKNLALALAGGAAILDLDQTAGLSAVTVVVFTALAVSLLVAEVVAYALSPRASARLLARARELTLRHEYVVVNAVLLGLALLFLVRGTLDLLR